MKILYTSDQVTQRVKDMAQEIINTYPTDKPLFVCLLKGAVPFASQLLTAITEINPAFYPEVEYMHVSAYGDKREASDATTVASPKMLYVDETLLYSTTVSTEGLPIKTQNGNFSIKGPYQLNLSFSRTSKLVNLVARHHFSWALTPPTSGLLAWVWMMQPMHLRPSGGLAISGMYHPNNHN